MSDCVFECIGDIENGTAHECIDLVLGSERVITYLELRIYIGFQVCLLVLTNVIVLCVSRLNVAQHQQLQFHYSYSLLFHV